ncbi:MAG: substrate-binding domain-containing protein [Verrucomicrobia bacterium]|nr:substrate-binding domain-containing protein [Verrucomicrobiota bacterium]
MKRTIQNLKSILALPILFLVGAALSGYAKEPKAATKPETKEIIRIGLSLADLKEERWQRDRDMFVQKAGQLGAKVMIQDAGGDPQTQIEQCETLLNQGATVLVVVPKNADTAARIVETAHRAKVRVLSYDRLIANADTDLYISFDNFKVGSIQAQAVLDKVPTGKYLLLGGDPADKNSAMLREGQMKALDPAVKAGKITIVGQPFCDKWLRAEAARHTEDALAKTPDLNAIVASNDGTAGGAIASLKSLAGKVAVSGQDADIEACQNVVKGLQTVTVYKPIRKIADAAAILAVGLAKDESVEELVKQISNAVFRKIHNGKTEVPTIFLEPVAVTKDNIQATVIADGFHSKEAVYGKH